MSPEVYAEEITNLLDRIREQEACKRSLEVHICDLIKRASAWSLAFQQCTPGGLEFQTPDACLVYVQVEREEQHHKIVQLTNERDAALKQIKEVHEHRA